MTTATSRLAPLRNQNYLVNISIHIHAHDERYEMSIQGGGKSPLRTPIDLNHHTLNDLNERLTKKIESIAKNNLDKATDIIDLAENGYLAFKRVFSQEAQQAITNLVSDDSMASIQITSTDFTLPWEILYQSKPDGKVSYNNFLGTNNIISRVVELDSRPCDFVTPAISTTSLPRLGLLTYQELEYVRRKEIPFFQKLKDDNKINLFKLRILNPNKNRKEELQTFKSFWDKSLHIAHFACHANYNFNPDFSQLILSNNFEISIQDIEKLEPILKKNPLVFLNACRTGNPNPIYSHSFAKELIKYGARGVIATDCAVSDQFAAEFAEYFYKYFLRGNDLGTSLLATRRHFLDKFNNIAGFLYSLYASPQIRLVS